MSITLRPGVFILLFQLATLGWGQSPALTHAIPAAALPGKTTEIKLHGVNLKGVTEIWASFGAMKALRPPTNADFILCELTLPTNALPGLGALRVCGTNGLSNLLLFLVDDLPSVSASRTNRTLAAAQSLNLPVAVDGELADSVSDCFKFTAKAGQSISVEVLAQRLGSKLDPLIRLLDATGRELAYSDDEAGLGADARFAHRFTLAGQYFLELRASNYEGGAGFRYRLRVGDFPPVSTAFPLGARENSEAQFTFAGRGAEKAKPLRIQVSAPALGISLSTKNPGGHSSAFAVAAVSPITETLEIEPNDSPAAATPVALPVAINGRFAVARDQDFYKFAVKPQERLIFTAQTRSLGSPSEVFFQLLDAKGRRLGESKPTDAGEGSLTNTFSEAGTCYLAVEEVARRGGPEHTYRLKIEPYAGFDLSLDTDKAEAPQGGSFALKVNAMRRDFQGPIVLTPAGLDGHWNIADNVIGEGKSETTIKISPPEDAVPGTVFTFFLLGNARVGETEARVIAGTQAALRRQFPDLPFPPRQFDGVIAIGILPAGATPSVPAKDETDAGKKKKKN